MGKSLTFWSIIIGFLLGFLQQNLYNFAKAIQTSGFLKAMGSINYTILVISVIVAAFLGCLFYLIERDQTEKSSRDTNITNALLTAIAKKLGVDTDVVINEIKEKHK